MLSKSCPWSEPEAEISVSGANGMRTLVIQSLSHDVEVGNSAQVYVNGRLFKTELRHLDTIHLLIARVPLDNPMIDLGKVEESIDEFGKKILERGKIEVKITSDLDHSIRCDFDSIVIHSSQILRN